ncbi:MAG: aldo/keto reductase [Phycisphaeraceae bacterium]|nr:aldo/keto reductase [Phycisphaerae bacterium]MBX3392043.1 aldo/keto reductase [Phycisphaeraceae bacterium]HRJ49820.1 aldo/keto reductase [Phycisphaerales bacterium]
MRYRDIPGTGLSISEIGFGCWTMGGPNWSTSTGAPIGWSDVNDDDILAGVKAGIDGGVNHWDNADIYGNGRAERTLAECFRKLGVNRDTQVIATKVGHFRGTAIHAYEPRHIRNQCEQSLRNLRTDRIDIYYFHHGSYVAAGYDARGNIVPDHDYLPEAARTMHDLVKEGKVRAVGQSAYTVEDFERAIPVLKPRILQNKANLRYDEYIRPGGRLESLMRAHDCALVAFGPLDQGILLDKFDPDRPPSFDEGDYRRGRKDFNPDTLRTVRQKLSLVRERFAGGSSDVTAMLSSIASRWVLAHERVASAIPGFRNQRQALCNLRAAEDPPMTEPEVTWLRELFQG